MFEVSKKTREKHLAFVQANWTGLAVLAYAGFLEKGRGMLFIDEKGWIHLPPGVICKARTSYIAEGSPEFAKMGQWPGGKNKEARWVQEYDPATTILFCFLRIEPGMETSCYRITGLPGGFHPKECWERQQAKDKPG